MPKSITFFSRGKTPIYVNYVIAHNTRGAPVHANPVHKYPTYTWRARHVRAPTNSKLYALVVADEELDVFFFIGRVDAFDELMLKDGFVDDITDTQDDFEGNAVFPHLVIADEGLEAGDAVFTVVEDMPGHAEGDVFDTLQVIVIGNGQGNGNGTFRQRLFVVGQRRRGTALVGDDDHVPRRRADGRIAPVHIDDAAGFAAGQTDVIAHVDLFRHEGRNAGKEVGQRILQGQSRCQAAGAERCQER